MSDAEDPLEQRLRAVLHRHAADARVSPDAWTAIQERTTPRRRALGHLRRLTPALAGLAAVVVLAAVAVPLARDLQGPGVRFAPPPAEPGAADPGGSGGGETDPGGSGGGETDPGGTGGGQGGAGGEWTRVAGAAGALSPGDPGGLVHLEDVAASGTRLVAVGSYQVGDDELAALWTSDDGGGAWTLAGDAGEAFGALPGVAGATQALAVAATADGFVAVGGAQRLDGGRQDPDPVAWTSPDGTAWTRTDLPGTGPLRDVAVVDGTVVAVGGPQGAGAVWRAEAGGGWERADLAVGDSSAVLSHVVEAGGRLVALAGQASAVSGDGGRTWKAAERETTGIAPGGVQDLVALPDGNAFAVVSGASGVVSYLSADGSRWTRATPFLQTGGDDEPWIRALAVTADGTVVALGARLTPAVTDGAIWSWRAGEAGWTPVADPAGALGRASFTAGAQVGDTLVVLGNPTRDPTSGGGAWIGPVP